MKKLLINWLVFEFFLLDFYWMQTLNEIESSKFVNGAQSFRKEHFTNWQFLYVNGSELVLLFNDSVFWLPVK